jgi:hypothetical protein
MWEEVAVTCCKLLASHLPGVADTNRENPLAVFRSEPRSVESVSVFRDPEHETVSATPHLPFFLVTVLYVLTDQMLQKSFCRADSAALYTLRHCQIQRNVEEVGFRIYVT